MVIGGDDGFLGGFFLYVVYIHVLNRSLDWPRFWTGWPAYGPCPLLARRVIATWGRPVY